MGKTLCPFCFNKFDNSELIYYCLECNTGIKVKELRFGELNRGVKCRTKTCHERTLYTKKCPMCNETLPDSLLDITNMPFSLIGSSGSGKTNYITVLLTELSKRSGNLKLSLKSNTPETRQSHAINRKMIYDEKLMVPATLASNVRANIWTIRNLKKKMTYVLNIFDGAGETHNILDEENAQRDARYIENSQAVIFVIDPLRFRGLRDLANNIDPSKSTSSSVEETDDENSVDVIHNAAKMMRNALRIRDDKIIDLYMAIVISKIDLFLNACFKGTTLGKDSPHADLGYFDTDDCKAVDKELTDWLLDNGEEEFINALEHNFYFKNENFHRKKCYLFGVSAFGDAPDEFGNVPQIHPHRVLDPILWLLSQQDFIDAQ